MGGGCGKMAKAVAEWTTADTCAFVQQYFTSEDLKVKVIAWISENEVNANQLLDMEMSMILTAMAMKHSDEATEITNSIQQLRELASKESEAPAIYTTLKDVPAALEKAVYVYEKYPLIIDETGQAAQFFKYQRGCFLMAGNPNDMSEENLRRSLVAALRHGSIMTICFDRLVGMELDQFFSETFFPSKVLDRHEIFKQEVYSTLLRKSEGDPDPSMFLPSDTFKFTILCGNIQPPPRTAQRMCSVRIQRPEAIETQEDSVAAALGLKELVRNSVEIVEAGFDGNVEEIKALFEKGFHMESEDGHKHTALSEAACQGHDEMISYLLSLGANPNSLNDVGRSPLYRAAYNGHLNVVQMLLQVGADPRLATKQGERPFDVAKNKEVASCLSEWDVSQTDVLLEERRQIMEKKLHERLTSHLEREQLAQMRIRDDLVKLASSTASGAVDRLLELLLQLAADAIANDEKPRGIADIRDDRGCTLLAIAAQHDIYEIVEMLLTHWKMFQDDSNPLLRKAKTNAKDIYMKVFRVHVNSRDQKGWTPIAIAIFHQSKKSAKLLLAHGANPRLKNQYNKSAIDFAQDEIDAALNIITSRQEIRSVLDEWESEQLASTLEHSRMKMTGVGAIEPLPSDGGATLLAIEIAKESHQKITKKGTKKPGKKSSKTKKTT